MKKLGKLSINPEKVIKNEELVNLRGGYGTGDMACYFYSDYNYTLICCRITSSHDDCGPEPENTVFTSYNTKAACSSSDYCD